MSEPSDQDIYRALKRRFGYESFVHPQEDIIKDVLAKKDVFVLMPTGGGKSLCYQLPALLLEGVTVVVSPLIALMKDQVDGLRVNGIAAAYINSTLSFYEIESIKSDLLDGKIKIIYIAPERLMVPEFLSFLKSLKVCLVAVDEVHCISEWGHDFRPAYRQLKLLKVHFPKAPLIALTATAVPEVQRDTINLLKLENPRVYRGRFNRRNLFYHVRPKSSAYTELLQYLRSHRWDPGIIYCFSRNATDSLAKKLQEEGFRALPYHAGLDSDLRAVTQERFINDDVEIVVATIAFGMGIDKPNIRFVIHYDLPKDLETYYQETGRAGRDGKRSDCFLFFSYGDTKKIKYLIEQGKDERQKRISYKKLQAMVDFCDSRTCRRKVLLEYFGEEYREENCGGCDICTETRETIEGTSIARKIALCVFLTGERFGAGHIADVLRGSKSQKVVRNGHDALEVHGTGKEYSASQWSAFMRELVQLGYLRQEGDKYPVLKLTEKGAGISSGGENILLTKPAEAVQAARDPPDQGFDHRLFDVLRDLRKRLSDAEKVPPYVIFHDSSLREMATRLPGNRSEFGVIGGVGEKKLEKYGELFLKEIGAYCTRTGDAPSTIAKRRAHLDRSGEDPATAIANPNPNPASPRPRSNAIEETVAMIDEVGTKINSSNSDPGRGEFGGPKGDRSPEGPGYPFDDYPVDGCVPGEDDEDINVDNLLEKTHYLGLHIRDLQGKVKELKNKYDDCIEAAKMLELDRQGPYRLEKVVTKRRKVDVNVLREKHPDIFLQLASVPVIATEELVGEEEMKKFVTYTMRESYVVTKHPDHRVGRRD